MPDNRITMRKHQYSGSVCAKSVFQNLSSFMLFPMMYSKLGHKFTNVKKARINKFLIAVVYTGLLSEWVKFCRYRKAVKIFNLRDPNKHANSVKLISICY